MKNTNKMSNHSFLNIFLQVFMAIFIGVFRLQRASPYIQALAQARAAAFNVWQIIDEVNQFSSFEYK